MRKHQLRATAFLLALAEESKLILILTPPKMDKGPSQGMCDFWMTRSLLARPVGFPLMVAMMVLTTTRMNMFGQFWLRKDPAVVDCPTIPWGNT